jgi:hypothetical protein
VPSTADGYLEVLCPGRADGRDDVIGRCTAGDECGSPVDGAVPDGPGGVVVLVLRTYEGTSKLGSEDLHDRLGRRGS